MGMISLMENVEVGGCWLLKLEEIIWILVIILASGQLSGPSVLSYRHTSYYTVMAPLDLPCMMLAVWFTMGRSRW